MATQLSEQAQAAYDEAVAARDAAWQADDDQATKLKAKDAATAEYTAAVEADAEKHSEASDKAHKVIDILMAELSNRPGPAPGPPPDVPPDGGGDQPTPDMAAGAGR
jgi:hypothetical protein